MFLLNKIMLLREISNSFKFPTPVMNKSPNIDSREEGETKRFIELERTLIKPYKGLVDWFS